MDRTTATELLCPYLRIEGLSKFFGTFQALNNVSLDIPEGSFVVFLGPSGCGKTTLLRAIAGLDLQSSGRITQAGKDISTLPPSQRDFGIVFQSYALFPNLTVAENVGYGLWSERIGRRATAERVAELLDLIGMPGTQAKFPAQLSGGQQQRVALARALARSPSLLLLDEPLSALDARVRIRLRSEIRSLQERLGITTIMVTHDQEEALTMADQVVVMNEGLVEQVGTPLQVYRNPATYFVANFVGSMNVLPGVVQSSTCVRVGTLDLVASAVQQAPGTEVLVCLRPEDVVGRNIDPTGQNVIRASIESLEFTGPSFRAQLRAKADPSVAFAADFSVNLMRDRDFRQDMIIEIVAPPDRLRLFAKA